MANFQVQNLNLEQMIDLEIRLIQIRKFFLLITQNHKKIVISKTYKNGVKIEAFSMSQLSLIEMLKESARMKI
jgi:hypothetical protein